MPVNACPYAGLVLSWQLSLQLWACIPPKSQSGCEDMMPAKVSHWLNSGGLGQSEVTRQYGSAEWVISGKSG